MCVCVCFCARACVVKTVIREIGETMDVCQSRTSTPIGISSHLSPLLSLPHLFNKIENAAFLYRYVVWYTRTLNTHTHTYIYIYIISGNSITTNFKIKVKWTKRCIIIYTGSEVDKTHIIRNE